MLRLRRFDWLHAHSHMLDGENRGTRWTLDATRRKRSPREGQPRQDTSKNDLLPLFSRTAQSPVNRPRQKFRCLSLSSRSLDSELAQLGSETMDETLLTKRASVVRGHAVEEVVVFGVGIPTIARLSS